MARLGKRIEARAQLRAIAQVAAQIADPTRGALARPRMQAASRGGGGDRGFSEDSGAGNQPTFDFNVDL
jgi:hypothetical protein